MQIRFNDSKVKQDEKKKKIQIWTESIDILLEANQKSVFV